MSSSRKSGNRPEPLLPCFRSNGKQVVVPMDVILHIASFTNAVDYKNFVRALWPDREGSYDHDVQVKLWQLSTHRFTTPFINGKPLEIEYNFDPDRKSDAILINSDCLRPVFGWLQPPGDDQFLRVSRLKQFASTNIHLNQCSRSRYASCPCGENIDNHTARSFLKPQMSTCNKQHFHHYCSYHVNYWFNTVVSSILHIQQNSVYDKDATENFISFLDTKVFFSGCKMQIVDSLLFSGLTA
ncbi:repeat element 3 [Diadegma semiclausum ichnovirus]|nr:repeat element 3 [Diadegma semiclausum ichnovirus]